MGFQFPFKKLIKFSISFKLTKTHLSFMEDKNDTQEVDENLDLPEVAGDEEEDTTDWEAEARKLQQKAIKQREKTKEYKAAIKAKDEEIASLKPKEKIKEELKISDEPDYARLAFLENKGVVHPDDQKLVQDEANRLKLPLTDILQMAHIKSQLDTNKDQRLAQEGMPKGRGQSGGGKTQQDVEYWRDKKKADGTYETPSDPELAEKVIDARIHKEEQGNKFSDELYS